jgi:hypothetical protein
MSLDGAGIRCHSLPRGRDAVATTARLTTGMLTASNRKALQGVFFLPRRCNGEVKHEFVFLWAEVC